MTYLGIDPSQWPLGCRARLYMVIDPRNGALLPPKLVLTTAAKIANDDRRHRVFSGGRDTNKRLEDLGFSVVERPLPAKTDATLALAMKT